MFIWDSANIGHIALHLVSPEEAEQVIANEPLDLERQVRNGEERVLHLGVTSADRVLFVVVTPRGNDLRVVTAFPANREARRLYREWKDQRDAEDNRNP